MNCPDPEGSFPDLPDLGRLDADGRPIGVLPDFARDPARLTELYRFMTRVRVFDRRACALQREGRIGTYPSCLGHEATHVGSAAALAPEDCLVPSYRECGAMLWRGVSMTDVLLYWAGDERGNRRGGALHDLPWCIPVGTQSLHAAGVAMAFRARGEQRGALTFIGDGATSQGAFYEALNVAGARQLPVVFVVVNNGWALSTSVSSQTAAKTLADKALAAGIPGSRVDGNDVIAVREAVGGAMVRARAGHGASLIEALVSRMGDEHAVHRLDPLVRLRRYLRRLGAWDDVEETALSAECEHEVDGAVHTCFNLPPQPTDAMFDYLFASVPRHLERQKRRARRYGQIAEN
jgi:pyruvate dehydrogenase E1 component alpha subunit